MRTRTKQIAELTREAERLGLGRSVIERLIAHVDEAEERGIARADIARASSCYDQGRYLDILLRGGSET